MAGTTTQNHLLSRLSPDDRGLLNPYLAAVDLPLRFSLEPPNRPIKHAYFPEHGIASIVASDGEESIEAGIFGSEGMSGSPLLMGNDRSMNSTYMQVAGHGLRISAGDLNQAMQQSPTLRISLLPFVQALMAQTAQTALANGRATIERRLARWILMAHDRLKSNEVTLTHEFMGLMLAVRRSGVTVALHDLEKRALIRTSRGLVVVLDRKGLEKLAGRIYGMSLTEYRRLIGWVPARSS